MNTIAELVCSKLEQHRKEWWVEPEQHYNEHRDIAAFLTTYSDAKNIAFKAFVGLVVIGMAVLAGLGAVKNYLGKLLS